MSTHSNDDETNTSIASRPASDNYVNACYSGESYFAIGSMMNPISVENRHLNLEANTPAMPAQLLDHKLHFYGSNGFAEAIPCPGATLHGVVYRDVPAEDMKWLDHVERDYVREKAKARLYPPNTANPQEDPRSFLADVTVYRRPSDVVRGPDIDKPPSERYIRIIVDGCRHHGVDPSYIEELEKQESTPRPSPKEYFSFPAQEGGMERTMTRQEVEEKGNGKEGNPLFICCNGRVIQFCGVEQSSGLFQEWSNLLSKYGQDVELFVAQLVYDPEYGVPKNLKEVSPEESAYREHCFCRYLESVSLLDKWQVIAKLTT